MENCQWIQYLAADCAGLMVCKSHPGIWTCWNGMPYYAVRLRSASVFPMPMFGTRLSSRKQRKAPQRENDFNAHGISITASSRWVGDVDAIRFGMECQDCGQKT